MVANIRLTQSVAQIEKEIMGALVKEVNYTFRNSMGKMLSPIRRIVSSAIESSPVISSLNGGVLRADFGIPKGKDVTSAIVASVANSTVINMKRFSFSGKKISGGLFVYVQPSSFANLLSLSVGEVVTEKGTRLPWLDWLLNLGDQVIIADFGVEYANAGRSGAGHMTSQARPFKVNTSFSGTTGNNFITRALDRHVGEIASVIERSL
jgi:hypothetical protein